jgi:septal ring factor EnvC (AmiA/AmiB activator)
MRIATLIIFILFTGAIGYQLYQLNKERVALNEEVNQVHASVILLEEEKSELEAELKYFSDSHNLLKELKSLFNYRKPQEKLIIIVPEE